MLDGDVSRAIGRAADGDIPDAQRHSDEYERERGIVELGHHDIGGGGGEQGACTSQRSLQYGAKFERLLPHGDARRVRYHDTESHVAGVECPTRRAAGEDRRVREHHQDREDALPGCHPPYARSGVLGICAAGRVRHTSGRIEHGRFVPGGARRYRRGHGIEHRGGIRRRHRREDRRTHRPAVRLGTEPLRGTRRSRFSRRNVGIVTTTKRLR